MVPVPSEPDRLTKFPPVQIAHCPHAAGSGNSRSDARTGPCPICAFGFQTETIPEFPFALRIVER